MNDPKCWDKFNKGNFENAYFIKFKYEGLKSIGIFPIKVIYRQQLLEFTYADGTEREHRGIETLRQKEDPIYGWEKEIRFFWTIPESVPANHHVYISQRQFRIFPEFIDSIQIHPHARKSLEDEIAQALKKTSYALIPILRASGTER